ncbi:MFS general substrate transporter [Thozetella sp. PMI_491]|nr:MFS general substrate transporter [Thozetella sp. PMI_491]
MSTQTTPHLAEEESYSTAGTATENTPLLRSETASSVTAAEDGLAGDAATGGPGLDAGPELGWKRVTCIVLSMWALIFLQASNTSGMTMTQSIIAEELNAYENAMWFTSAYLITAASVAPLVGRLAMIFSPSIITLAMSVFFSIGALVTSQAWSFSTFILGRVLFGVGGGGILTLSQVLIIQLTSKKRRGLFIGLGNAGFTVGLSTGAVVFGALVERIGWRALFLAQSPLGIIAGIGVYLTIPPFHSHERSKDKSTLQKLAGIDYAGALLLTTAIVVFLYGLAGAIQPLTILVSLLILAGFIAFEYLVASDPIIPLAVLENRGVLMSCLAQLGFMAARWSILFFAPIFVLAVWGLGPALAGSVLIATNAGFGTGGLVVGWLHIRHAGSFWLPCLIALFFFGLALFGISCVSYAAAPVWLYLALLFLNGICTGAELNYTLAHMLHLVNHEMHYVATGMLATFRGFAGSFGTAIGGGIFSRTLTRILTEGLNKLDGTDTLSPERVHLIKKLIGSPALVFGGGLTDAERAVAVGGYETALKVLYQSAAALCIVVFVVQACTGWTGPVSKEEEEEIEEAIAEHDGTMEA